VRPLPTRPLFVAVIGLSVLSLGACNGRAGQARAGGAAGICTPFATPVATAAAPAPAPAPPSVAPDAAAPVDDCLHRWAYSLAGATDTAEIVAQATVAACSSALTRWNSEADAVPTPGQNGPPVEPLSLVTGQPTNALVEHHDFAVSRALFYVVQARAGHCPPPPAVKTGQAG